MSKMPINVINFTANSQDRKEAYAQIPELLKAYNDNKASVRGANGDISFAEAERKVLDFYISEIEFMSGKKIEDYPDMAIYCNFSDVKEAAFAIMSMMTDLVLPDALIKDLGYLANFKNGGWGESLSIDIKPRDLFVVSKGSFSKASADVKKQFKGTVTIVPEVRTISVGVNLYDVLRGDYSLAEFLMKAVQSVEVQMRYDVYDAFATAMGNLANSGDAGLRVTGYTQSDAIKLAQKVTAWNGGNKAIFLGTALALSKILPASTNFRFDIGSEYVRLGHIREFFGFSVVELEQIADYSTEFKVKLADDKIYVISPTVDKIVKVFLEGSTLAKQGDGFNNANLMVEANLKKSWGVGVATSAIGGVIEITA